MRFPHTHGAVYVVTFYVCCLICWRFTTFATLRFGALFCSLSRYGTLRFVVRFGGFVLLVIYWAFTPLHDYVITFTILRLRYAFDSYVTLLLRCSDDLHIHAVTFYILTRRYTVQFGAVTLCSLPFVTFCRYLYRATVSCLHHRIRMTTPLYLFPSYVTFRYRHLRPQDYTYCHYYTHTAPTTAFVLPLYHSCVVDFTSFSHHVVDSFITTVDLRLVALIWLRFTFVTLPRLRWTICHL